MKPIVSRTRRRIWSAVGLIIPLLLLMAALAHAQIKIETPPPDAHRRPQVIPPPLGRETTRIPELDLYPRAPSVPYDPAFIDRLTAPIETPRSSGRAGLSGWTSPNTPVGAPLTHREVNGWLGFGFSATWGAPLRSQTPAAASVSSAEPARPMRVGDLVKKKTGKSAAPGRVVTFFDRDGVTHAVVEWSPSSESTSERLDQLELL